MMNPICPVCRTRAIAEPLMLEDYEDDLNSHNVLLGINFGF